MSVSIPRAENDLRKAIVELEALSDVLHKVPGANNALNKLTEVTGLVFGALETLEKSRVYEEAMPLVTPEVDPTKNIFRYGEDKG